MFGKKICYQPLTIVCIQLKVKSCLLLPFYFFKKVLGTRYNLCCSKLTLFLKNSQDYVVKLSHFGQLKPKKSPELLSYSGQKPLLIPILINWLPHMCLVRCLKDSPISSILYEKCWYIVPKASAMPIKVWFSKFPQRS